MKLDGRLVAVLVATAWELAVPAQAQFTFANNNTNHLAFFPGLLHPETTSSRAYCPASCAAAGPTSFSWSRIFSIEELERCEHTVIFEAMLGFPLELPGRQTVLKACTSSITDPEEASGTYGPHALFNADVVNTTAQVQTGWAGRPASQLAVSQIVESALKLKHQVALNPNNRLTAVFAKSGKTVVGLYAGGQVHRSSVASLMNDFTQRAAEVDMPSRLTMQVCGPTGNSSAALVFGMVADADGDLQSVHKALSGWAEGKCADGFDGSSTAQNQTMALISAVPLIQDSTTDPLSNQTLTNSTSLLSRHRRYADLKQPHQPLHRMRRRAGSCRVAKVNFGDSCWSIAEEKCGISLDNLYTFNGIDDAYCGNMETGDELCCSAGEAQFSVMAKEDDECEYTMVKEVDSCPAIAKRCDITLKTLVGYNGGDETAFCNFLKPKTAVCCSKGEKPDLKPQPQKNGDCAVHEVQKDDGCWAIADKYYLTQKEIHQLNVGKTWGWAGCGQLLADQKICISKGTPPMPVQVKNVTCGPQVIGTKRPADGTNITDLNPCPLNVCCSGWGYCGLTEEFCTDTSIDNTPGTHEPNTNGCISNCGKIEIINNDTPPKNFIRVGYFEAWNGNRPCLNMDVTEVKDPITHIHFAFGHISEDFVPSAASDVTEQWSKFLGMTGPKKIMSFGGWAFSNEQGTSHIIRQGVKPDNRQKFADNIVKFVVDNKLDGVDFDWEYPGADDIEGSDPGKKEDGVNYLKFLTLVRDGLPAEKSLAIAAPASYWYLRHFPIENMAKILSYIVFMTYDLHGQWDYSSKWASTGCANGDCLRSHVNVTETINSLAMITRAGVPSNKVIVGITSYGRSFKMADANCWGPSCLYLGPRNNSPAQPGKCTDTGGYIANGEIEEIIKSKAAPFKKIYDEESDSDILIYNSVEYVGYMSQETKDRRVKLYKGLNFGGATDWAVDLMGDTSPGSDEDVVYIGTPVYTYPSMGCTAPCTIVLPPSTLASPSVFSISPYTTSLQVGTTTTTITIKVPAQTIDEVPFYNVPIPSDVGTQTVVQPYPSITLPPTSVPVTWVSEGTTKTTTRTIFLPPWPQVTQGPPASWSNTVSPSNIPTTTDDSIPDPPEPTVPFPTWNDWYKIPHQIQPVTEPPQDDDDDDDDDDDVVIIPCSLWFFSTCIKIGKFEIKGWKLRIPQGIIGPGPPPPPLIPWPTGWQWKGPRLPPWPKITIGPNSKPTGIPEKPGQCETKSASVCMTTTSYDVEDKGTTTVTVTSRVVETCATIYGCAVEGYDEATATDDISCALAKRTAAATLTYDATPTPGPGAAQPSVTGSIEPPPVSLDTRSSALVHLGRRATEDDEASWDDDIRLATQWFCARNDVIIFTKQVWDSDPDNAALAKRLTKLKDGQDTTTVTRIQSSTMGFTAFWHVSSLPVALHAKLLQMKAVEVIYDPLNFRRRAWYPDTGMEPIVARSVDVDVDDDEPDNTGEEVISGDIISKRAVTQYTDWANSQISVPPYVDDWATNTDFSVNPGASQDASMHKYHFHESAGEQQYIYIVESCVDATHPEFIGIRVASALRTQNWGSGYSNDCMHGTAVSAMAVGTNLGVARKSILVPVHTGSLLGSASQPAERYLEALVLVLDDILSTSVPKEGKAVVSMSWGIGAGTVPKAFGRVMQAVLEEIADSGGVLVAASGNSRHKGGSADSVFPQRVMGQGRLAESSLVVGATDGAARLAPFSERFGDNQLNRIIHAPGQELKAAVAGATHKRGSGTSYAAPKVAGLVAYYRALPSRWKDQLTVASSVKRLVQLFERNLRIDDGPWKDLNPSARNVKFIWNGQVLDQSCLINGQDLRYNKTLVCPIIPDDLRTCPLINRRASGADGGSQFDRRACEPAPGGPGNGGNGDGGGGGEIGDIPVPPPITWKPGPAQPTCEHNCGVRCEGYYCIPTPTGSPPDFTEPSPPPPEETEEPEEPEEPPFPTDPPTFYLADVTWASELSTGWYAQAIKLSNWGDCDAMDKAADKLDGAEGDYPGYPWPEEEFTGELCEQKMRYRRKDNGDYDVFDEDSDKQIGICTEASEATKVCGIWIQATYNRGYECTGAC